MHRRLPSSWPPLRGRGVLSRKCCLSYDASSVAIVLAATAGQGCSRLDIPARSAAVRAPASEASAFYGAPLPGRVIHLVGAKGTGMAALAEILAARGARLSGADVAEDFQTKEILDRLALPLTVGFAAADLPQATELVVHSAAYLPADNPQLLTAAARGITVVSYPQALGELSRAASSIAVSGTHGKTSTAALCGLLVDALELPATVLTGTGVPNFGGSATIVRGSDYLVAETCEYRHHFDNYHPRHVVVTSVELEHLDAFATHAAVVDAFVKLARSVPQGGRLIYHSENAGATEVATQVAAQRSDVELWPYGESAPGDLRVADIRMAAGETRFRLECLRDAVSLRVPGRHHVFNAAAAVGVAATLLTHEGRTLGATEQAAVIAALRAYRGGKRRTEIVGEQRGVLVIDDYGHHPTELATTLAGLREFYPDRRLVVDFMSHTFSRTEGLLEEFGTAFAAADEVLLHPIYASARELGARQGGRLGDTTDSAGRVLYERVARRHPRVSYYPTFAAAAGYLAESLVDRDLLITMGAGDNWQVGRDVLQRLTTSGGGDAT